MAGEADSSLFHVGENVEFWRVLVHLCVLVLFIIIFEQLLHKLEHVVERYRKYEEMLSKVYRELMILGFIGLGIKIFKEISGANGYGKPMIAFQVADLTVFILALALVVQAICIFLRLKRKNMRVDRAELISTHDLADSIVMFDTKQRFFYSRLLFWRKFRPNCAMNEEGKQNIVQSWSDCEEISELRVLRHLFLRRYGLPELFPFAKYLRRAQDNQITHMIDVEISTWILLIAVGWLLEIVKEIIKEVHNQEEKHALVAVFLVGAWLLLILHIAVTMYFCFCMRQLLRAAGYNSQKDIITCLKTIAEEENNAWSHELAGDALKLMQQAQEKQEAMQLKRRRRRHHLLKSDTGFQLLATCCRHLNSCIFSRNNTNKNSMGGYSSSTDDQASPISTLGRPELHCQHSMLPVEIRWFSRKAWHFVVMFLLVLNGFYLALLCQCIIYQLTWIYHEFGLFSAVLIPLPLFLNIFVFQPRIFRNFMVICSIFRVDVNTLSDVINHFSEIVELRSEFAHRLVQNLRDASRTDTDLQQTLEKHDPRRTGMIDVEKLRTVLRGFGFRLSPFRFNSVVKLLFGTKGTKLEYAQLLRLVRLVQNEDFPSMGVDSTGLESISGHRLLRQSTIVEEPDVESTNIGSSIGLHTSYVPPTVTHIQSEAFTSAGGSSTAPVLETPSPPAMLTKTKSDFFATSSKAMRRLYHIESEELDHSESSSNLTTHYSHI